MPTIYLTSGNDSYMGYAVPGDPSSVIYAGAGDDAINSWHGWDTVYLGDGNDAAYLDAGEDVFYGEDGDDLIAVFSWADPDWLYGGSGTDTVLGYSGAHIYLHALSGFETFSGSISEIWGSAGADALDFSTITSTVYTGWIDALAGNDKVWASGLNDKLYGGDGLDTLSYENATSAITVSLNTGGAQATGGSGSDNIANFEYLIGSAYNDVLGGTNGGNEISGGDGDDVIYGLGGADLLNGGGGSDTSSYIHETVGVTVNLAVTTAQTVRSGASHILTGIENLLGSNHNDALTGDSAANTLTGGEGNDTLVGGAGNDVLDGGADSDTVIYAGAYADYALTISGMTVTVVHTASGETDTLTQIETIVFSDQTYRPAQPNQTITGTTGNDFLAGGNGNDTIDSLAGNDDVYGGYGDDSIVMAPTSWFSSGSDIVDGGAGSDTIIVAAGSGTLWVRSLTNIEAIDAGGGGVSISGIDGSDDYIDLRGVAINGTLAVLGGGSGNDVLYATAGNDTIAGWGGDDFLYGGAGDDTFTYSGNYVSVGYDEVYGGDGYDVLKVTSDFTDIGLDAMEGIEKIDYNGFNAKMYGSVHANSLDFTNVQVVGYMWISMQQGDDTVIGNDADSFIGGGQGHDWIEGRGGNDVMEGGNDLGGGVGDADSVVDTVSYEHASGAVTVALVIKTIQNTISAGWDTITHFERLVGSAYGDNLTGDDDADLVEILEGRDGDDHLHGMRGNDTLNGGAGHDTAYYVLNSAGVVIDLSNSGPQNVGYSGYDTLISIEGLVGSDYGDTLTGNGAANTLDGGAGNDILTGAGGDDTLYGGTGDDQFNYSGAVAGYDAVYGGANTDVIQARANDTVIGLHAVTGVETITADGFSNVSILGSTSANTWDFTGVALTGIVAINGGDGADNITGTTSADVLIGGAGDDTLYGGSGNDTFRYSGAVAGFDTLYGGLGTDTVEAAADNTVIGLHSLATVDAISSGGFTNVTILGSTSNNIWNFSSITLTGIAAINGGDGNDNITGSTGADILIGGAGSDTLSGGDGDDEVHYGVSTSGFDTLNGGLGTDVVKATANNAVVTVQSFTAIETFDGAGFSNVVIRASGNADTLDFTGVTVTGIASIDLGSGNDTFVGSSAADTVIGGNGNDNLEGADGNDVFRYAGSNTGFDTVAGGNGSDTLTATANGTVIGLAGLSGVETITSGGFSNVAILGSANADTLDFSAVTLTSIVRIDAGSGADAITGSTAADVIWGNAGDDTLSGSDGDDSLRGDAGADTLQGGAGADAFLYAALADSTSGARDVILDFSTADADRINLSALDAVTGGGDDAFTFTGSFSNTAGELISVFDTDHYEVQGDVDGDGAADFIINVYSGSALTSSDFIL